MAKSSLPSGSLPQGSGGDAGLSAANPGGDSRQAAPKWLGKRIGRFRLQALIGQGAMGRVFRAEDTTLQRRVALKVISLFDRTGQINSAANRFLTEARAAAALEHPHVVQIFEAGEAGNVCYIAMELLEGGSLRELVEASGPLDVHRACQLTAEAAEALAIAHAAGIIHRDVKPANLMLSRQGRCKVTDFGLAVMEDDSTGPAPTLSERRVGTPLFASPEVISGASADERSDLYSLGATLFFLLTGRPPFIAHGRAAAMRAHLEQPVPDIRALRGDLPNGLPEAIARSLDKDPGGRFMSAEQFSRVLRVYTIPVAGAAMASGGMSIPTGMGGGGSGSMGASSGGMGNYGSGGSGSMYGSGSLGGTGSGPLGATSRFAEMETGPAPSTPPLDETSVMLSAIPVAHVVPPDRRVAGISGAAWAGIVAGVIIAGSAVAWTLLRGGSSDKHPTVASTPPAAQPVPQPAVESVASPPAMAGHQETPAPAPVSVPTPAVVSQAPTPPPPNPQPAPSVAVKPQPKEVVTPTPAPAASASANPSTDELPVGVFRPRDMAALRLVAEGKDPSHPDSRAVVQGKVQSAGPSSTGNVFHIKFTGVGGADAFDVAYFKSVGMFEKMEARFGTDVPAALIGKTIRVSGKMRLFHDSPEMTINSPDDLQILDQ